jgi:PAS domain S-box-containing protein
MPLEADAKAYRFGMVPSAIPGQDLLSAFLATVPDLVFFKDRQLRYVSVSASVAQRFNSSVEDMLGKSVFDYFDDAQARTIHELQLQTLNTGEALIDHLITDRWPDGRVRWGLLSIMPLRNDAGEIVGIFGTEKDVTAAKLMEQALEKANHELAAAQRLESVGRLAAGVAHEINTPVQFVSDNVEFVRTSLPDLAGVIRAYRNLQHAVQSGSDVAAAASLAAASEGTADLDYILENAPPAIESAIEGLGRIATIVRSMKEFAHPDQGEKKFVDLNQAIRSTLIVARNEYKYVAEIDAQFGELPAVSCYLGEFNQVILNLLVNASHAIADVVKDTGNLGMITVRTRRDGEAVEVSIGDTGTGIPESARARLFDPFFTTKEVGKGTGQGLAIARSVIVKKHGGTLRFDTQCGQGTTFFIRLPIDAA